MTVTQDPQLTYGEMRTVEEKVIDEIVLERVKRGIALLEQEHGPDWVNKINMDTLDLRCACQCVLGQLYGTYSRGVDKLDENQEHGWFDAHEHGFCENSAEKYQVLTSVWKDVLTPRVKKENGGHTEVPAAR